MADDDLIEETSKSGAQITLVLATVVAVGLAAFVVQNGDKTPVTWLMFDWSAPLWIVIVISAVAGAVLSEAAGWMMRRRRRRR